MPTMYAGDLVGPQSYATGKNVSYQAYGSLNCPIMSLAHFHKSSFNEDHIQRVSHSSPGALLYTK